MTKGNVLPSYTLRRKRDRVLLFRKRVGGRIFEYRMQTQFDEGDPIPLAFYEERERLLKGHAESHAGRTVTSVIQAYRASSKYRDLAARTQQDYDSHIDYLDNLIGHVEPKSIERHHVIKWQDKWAKDKNAHTANYRRRVLSILMEHAKDMGLLLKSDENPVKGVRSLKYCKKERLPWPTELIAKFRESYSYQTRERLCFELLLGSGQRIGDVLKMQWAHIEKDGINVIQNKTGKRLWVPLTLHLKAALGTAKHRSLFILAKDMTKTKNPGTWSYRSAADAMRKARQSIGAEAYDLHALRYTAASELLEAGCDDELIAAITGQSTSMVQYYTRATRQKFLAAKAAERRK